MRNAYIITILAITVLVLTGCGGTREPQTFWHAQDCVTVCTEIDKMVGNKPIGVAPRTDGSMRSIALDDSAMRYADGPSSALVQTCIDYCIFKLTGQRVLIDAQANERVVLAGDVDGTFTCTITVGGGPAVAHGPTAMVSSQTKAIYSAPTKNEAVGVYVGFCLMQRLLSDQVAK